MRYSELARKIAMQAHDGQFRRDGTTPYIVHPRRVAQRVGAAGHDDMTVAVAWLHDVLEDTRFTSHDLRVMGMNTDIIRDVEQMTRFSDDTYDQYITSYLHYVSSDRARHVKVHDLLDNLSDTPTRGQIKRYSHALAVLSYDYGK